MQSLNSIAFVRLRSGEENFNSKLTNKQSLDIFTRSNNGENVKNLAKEFNISERYIRDIKNIRTRIKVTLNYINNVKEIEPSKATVAKRDNNKKLSYNLAQFIRRDKVNLMLTTKQLANKYCVTTRTIQRILKGQMYKT
jgi:hypothetical protein